VSALMLFGWMLARYTYNRRRLFMVVDTIVAVGAASAAFGLWRQVSQQEMGFGLPFLRPGYGYAQFINANHFAFLMEMVLGLAVGIAISHGVAGRRLYFYLMASVVMWVAVVRVNSRGGIVSMVCQLALLAILLVIRGEQSAGSPAKAPTNGFRKIATRVILVAVLVAGGILTVVQVGGDPLAVRIDKLSVEFDSKTAETYALRQSVWQATFDLIKRHPIAGVGFGGYWIAVTKYHSASGEVTPQEAHSDYLELLASGGLIAVAIAIWFIVALVAVTRRALRSADSQDRAVVMGAGIGMLTISVHSLVDFGLHVTIIAVVFTLLIGLICAVEKRNASLV
jgi:O-antigen ligase